MSKYTINDLFCGAGGVAIGFLNAGFDVTWACDFDAKCVETYRHNVGEWVQQADVTKLSHRDIPKADGWAFGFPCQDLSVAGKQAGFVFRCIECGEEWKHESEFLEPMCPKCGSVNFSAVTRSACFFEVMRLLDETKAEAPENYPKFLFIENVKGLKNYIPTLNAELDKRGYTAHIQLFNSKYWNVPQNRERYFIVATLKDMQGFEFPEEQHEFVPKLSTALDKEVDEKYYIPDEKAQKIIMQALQRIEQLGQVHSCITPDRVEKRQNGRRAKNNEEEMFTLTAQDIHGIVVKEKNGVSRDAFKYIADKLLQFVEKNGYIPKFFNPYNCSDVKELAPTATTACGGLTTSATVLVFTDSENGEPCIIQLPRGKNAGGVHDVAPTVTSNAYQENNFVCENIGTVNETIVDDTYGFDEQPRIYGDVSPTLRSSRQGLKVIVADDEETAKAICNETGLLDTEGQGKTLRVGGGGR